MNDNLNLVPVIMAGGAGTRFWPMSTEQKPKQFLNLFGERTLLQQSFDRVKDLAPPEHILVLTNARFTHYVQEQLPELPLDNIIGEPMRRDTAAAMTLAALLAEKKQKDAVMAVLTADHLIEPKKIFQEALLEAAQESIRSKNIYTFGIKPDYAATGYGYLETGESFRTTSSGSHYRLSSFKEKPDENTARDYLQKGNYFWNSGMFIGTAKVFLQTIEQHLPEHIEKLSPTMKAYGTSDWKSALAKGMEPLTSISIDFGVMEKASDLSCMVASFSWKDVGGWLALEELLPKKDHGNSCRGDLQVLDACDNLVFCENKEETIALIGVDNLVIVRAGKYTLITERKRAEDIKKLVAMKK